MSPADIEKANAMGIELGFFFQFGVFSYVMAGILNRNNKERIKEHLSKVSSILQYLSFESIEKMLYSIKSLDFARIQKEFVVLTVFHSSRFLAEIDKMEVDTEIKENFHSMIHEFLEDLFAVTGFRPEQGQTPTYTASAF